LEPSRSEQEPGNALYTFIACNVPHKRRGTAVSAVHDGYVLNNSILQSPVGGRLLTEGLRLALSAKGAKLQPWYSYRTGAAEENGRVGSVASSAAAWATAYVVGDIKESLCRVNEVPFVEKENLNMPVQSYELPDGSSIDIGVERFNIPEILFNSVRAAHCWLHSWHMYRAACGNRVPSGRTNINYPLSIGVWCWRGRPGWLY
jgi:actin-related protein